MPFIIRYKRDSPYAKKFRFIKYPWGRDGYPTRELAEQVLGVLTEPDHFEIVEAGTADE